jgi:RNA polymerase sigma factor (sigma-70 family)
METQALADVLHFVRCLASDSQVDQHSDGQLLQQFITWRDEPAFAALLQRHGPLVLTVCRQVLGDEHDAEDAFQATFLVLARKAASIHKQVSLAAWLHRVAVNLARTARHSNARRRAHERQATLMSQSSQMDPAPVQDWQPLVHEEVDRLPQKYRLPIVLCYFEGNTHQQAARELGWPLGTIKGRLARARALLHSRLARRGLTLSVGGLAAALTQSATPGQVPPALLGHTLRVAVSFAAGGTVPAGAISAQALALTKGALHTMTVTKLLALLVLLGTIGVVGFAAALGPGPGRRAKPEDHLSILTGRPAPPRGKAAVDFGPKDARNVIEKDGIRFEFLIPERDWTIPKDAKGSATQVHLGLRITNRTQKPLRFSGFATLAPEMLGPYGQPLKRIRGSDGTYVRKEVDCPLLKPGESLTFSSKAMLTWRNGKLEFGSEGVLWGGFWYFVDLQPGRYRIRLRYANSSDEFMLSMGQPPVVLQNVWNGEIETPFVEVNLKPPVPVAKAVNPRLKLGVIAPTKALAIGDEIKLEVVLSAEDDQTYEFQLGAFPQAFGIYLRGPKGVIQPDKVLPQNWMHQEHGPATNIRVSKGKPYRTTVKLSDYFPVVDVAQFKPGTYQVNVKFYDVGLKMPGPIDSRPVRFKLVPKKLEGTQKQRDEARKRLEDAVKEDLKQLQGTWHMVACEEGGKPFAPEQVNPLDYLTFSETTFYFKSGQRGLKGTFTIDPSKNPKWMDQTTSNGLVFKGHYELMGDVLRVYLGAPGGNRPTELKSKEGEKLWLRTYERVKAKGVGHAREVYGVALSADGKQLVTGSGDTTAILWDTTTAKQLQTFQGHTQWVFRVAVSADGKKVATGSHDKTAILWDAATGKKLQTFQGHTAEVSSVVLSVDGKHVLTASWDHTAILWEAATGKKVQILQGRFGIVTSVALSSDGKHVVTGSMDKTAILWDAAAGKQLQIFRGHRGGVFCVALSADGQQLVTGSEDRTAILWDVATNQQRHVLVGGHTGDIVGVALSADGKRMVTGSEDKTAILWDTVTGKLLQTFHGHTGEVSSVALSADGKQVATGSYDKSAILWDAATGKQLQVFDGKTK